METRKKTTIIGALVAGAVLTIASVGVAAAQTPDATPSTTPPAQGAPATPGDGEHPCPKDGTGHQARGQHGEHGQGEMQGQMGARHAQMQARMAAMHAQGAS
ncbi:MAG: hypothetical protein AB7G21_03210 [Dehalococcoidia bacterium]